MSKLWKFKKTVIFCVLLGLVGCVGYRLGSTLPPDIKTVYVPLFANRSREPLIENDATRALIAELQKDGTLKVVNIENADVILECTLTSVSLNPLRYNRDDVTKPNEYRLTLAASFTLKRVRNQDLVCEASVIGESTFPFVGNLVSAKQSATPRAAEDLAKRIVEKAVEAW
ncbi:MAG: LptE family protein [Kiritimatiellia bacterium]|nr:LptE family protein [Kiritimatiellia bacterium]